MSRARRSFLLALLTLVPASMATAAIVCTVQEIDGCVAFRQCCFTGPNGEEQGCWVMYRDCTP